MQTKSFEVHSAFEDREKRVNLSALASQTWLGIASLGDLTKMYIVWSHHQTWRLRCFSMGTEGLYFNGITTKRFEAAEKYIISLNPYNIFEGLEFLNLFC